MKWNREWVNKRWVSLTIAICIGVVLFLFLSNMPTVFDYIGRFLHFFRPVMLGVVFAYLLNPLVRLLEFRILKKVLKPRSRHFVSVVITCILVAVGLFLLGFFLIPQIVLSVGMFIGNLDGYMKSASEALGHVTEFFARHNLDISNFIAHIEEFFSGIQNALPSSINGILGLLSNVGTNIMDILIAMILTLYFLTDKDRLVHGISKIIKAIQKPATYVKTMSFFQRVHNILIRYILFDLLDAFFVGVANGIFMLAAGLPYGVLISVVVAVTNLAPTFGPIVGAVIGGFLLFLVNPVFALWFLIFTVILQIFDGYVLKPRMFSGALGVPGVLVIVCIVVGGKMFGVWGILLAIPFAAIAYYMVREAVGRKLESREAGTQALQKTEPETEVQ